MSKVIQIQASRNGVLRDICIFLLLMSGWFTPTRISITSWLLHIVSSWKSSSSSVGKDPNYSSQGIF